MSTPRLIEGMPFDQYLAHPALSASGMKRILDCPARFNVERPDTTAMKHGRLIHAIALNQPHDAIVKDWDARTKEGKTRAAEVLAAHGVESVDDLELVSADAWDTAEGIAVALHENALSRRLLFSDGVKHEATAIWTDDETGVELRCRFDAINGPTIGDLKSTTNAQPNAVARQAADYGWYISAAHYRAGAIALGIDPDPEFVLVAVEKTPPYFISAVGVSEYDLQLGEALRRKAITTFAECTRIGHWPDYTTQIRYPDPPAWWRITAENETGLYDIEVPA